MHINGLIDWGSTATERQEGLQTVLETANRNHLKMNKGKCHFKTTEITYLGKLTTKKIMPADSKTQVNLTHRDTKIEKKFRNCKACCITSVSSYLTMQSGQITQENSFTKIQNRPGCQSVKESSRI